MPNRIGLIASGAVSQSFVARLPFVRDRLGPVYSPALRNASRIVNGLRIGIPVSEFVALSRCGMVLIAVPDDLLEATVSAAAAESEARWQRKIVVLCGSAFDAGALDPLQKLGAYCVTLDAVPASGEARFVTDGDPAAVAELRRLFGRSNLFVLDRGGKAAYQAGILLATDLALEMTAGAVESLRTAGLSRPQAVPVVEALMTQTARAYGKAGRRAATGMPSAEILAYYAKAIRDRDPALARLFERALALYTEK